LAGLYGAAVATGSANFFKNLFIWWHVRKRAVWMNFRAVLVNCILVWGSAVGLCYGLKAWLGLPALIHLGLGMLVCAAAALVYVRTPAIRSSDRRILASILGGRESKLLHLTGLVAPSDKPKQ
jgi:hypothetical protein